MQIGNKIFYKHEPVIYFDTLKTSQLEGSATQVYAQGGTGNPRLVQWEGERVVTFTMEDALISPEGFMILSGAGLVEATSTKPLYHHVTETIDKLDITISDDGKVTIPLSQKPYLPGDKGDNFAYVMFMRDGEIITEPYIPTHGDDSINETGDVYTKKYEITVEEHDCYDEDTTGQPNTYTVNQISNIKFDSVLVDYYVARGAAMKQIEITSDQFGGNFYLEASTLFRTPEGIDMPAEFIIPNCKIQSNFTFAMANSGDPTSFTFTLDAFPDYTRFDHSKKVFAAVQILEDAYAVDYHRGNTPNGEYSVEGIVGNNSIHENLWRDSAQG